MTTHDPHPPEFDCPEYSADLYVTRPAIEVEIGGWLKEMRPVHSIRSLVGPPGTGKSWFLAHFRDNASSSCARIFMAARDLIDTRLRDQVKMDLIRVVNDCCPDQEYPDDLQPTLEAIIEGLSEHIVQQCGSKYILLLVDGCDDLDTPDEFEKVQEVLASFFQDGMKCFRMLIARRSRMTRYELRRSDLPVHVDVFKAKQEPNSPQDQARKLIQRTGEVPGTVDLMSIAPRLSYYQWNHPFINCYLLKRWLKGASITSNVLRTCCLALVNRPTVALGRPERHPEMDGHALNLLIRLACELPMHWQPSDFKRIAVRDLNTADTRRGTIVNVRDTEGNITPMYSIADGLRELLMDIAQMQRSEVEL